MSMLHSFTPCLYVHCIVDHCEAIIETLKIHDNKSVAKIEQEIKREVIKTKINKINKLSCSVHS